MSITRDIRWLGLVLLAPGCANLPVIEENVCGNSIVESGEACDGYVETDNQYCREPGADGECRFDCTEEHECPEGLDCGGDGICRTGSGEYTSWRTPIALNASRLLLGDFDGDRRDDLVALGNPNSLWQAQPKVFFFDESAEPFNLFEPKIPVVSPSIADLTPADESTDYREQLLFATPYGLASLSASTDSIVQPDPYAFQTLAQGESYRVYPIEGLSSPTLGEGVLVLYGPGEETIVIAANADEEIGRIPRSLDSLVLGSIKANVLPLTPCTDFLYAFDDGPSVYALSPCDTLGQWHSLDSEPTTLVTLNDDHEIVGPILVGKVNEDEIPDLVVKDEAGRSYVSFGLGDGRFAADPSQVLSTVGQALPLDFDTRDCAPSSATSNEAPLAIGDLNGDGRDDWVLPSGVVLTQGSSLDFAASLVTVSGCPGNAPFADSWATAEIGDFNRDGVSDLAAGLASSPDLDFFLGTGADVLNHFGIPTNGIVSHLLSGDFDGDLTVDLAFSTRNESVADEASNTETVYIANGELAGAPTLITQLGRFQNLRQLVANNYVGDDLISELGVVSKRDDSLGEELAMFIGNAGRHPIAPLGLMLISDAGENYFDTPLATISGRFISDSVVSTIAVGQSCDDETCQQRHYRLWESSYDSVLGYTRPAASLTLPDNFTPLGSSNDALGLHLVSGDLNQDGLDELLVLSTAEDPGALDVWRMPSSEALFSETPDEDAQSLRTPLTRVAELDGKLLPNSDPTLVDLDLDGRLDLAVVLEQPSGQNALQILWNDSDETLAVASPPLIDLEDEEPLGIAGTNGRLLIITNARVWELPTFSGVRGPRTGTSLEGVPGGKALAVGDMTGDGLADLAISTGTQLVLFTEVEQEP